MSVNDDGRNAVLKRCLRQILSLEQYEKLLEDVHDLAVVGDRIEEQPITLEELKERLTL